MSKVGCKKCQEITENQPQISVFNPIQTQLQKPAFTFKKIHILSLLWDRFRVKHKIYLELTGTASCELHQIVSVCPCYTLQVSDLKEHELEWVARHLGYDISVHRENYRLHDDTAEVVKVGEVNSTKYICLYQAK